MSSFQQTLPFTDTNPFGRTRIDLLNDMAAELTSLQSLRSSIQRQLKEIIPPWNESAADEIIDAQVRNSSGQGWPKVYSWGEIEYAGETGSVGASFLRGGRNGFATNTTELLEGFGVSVGPGGASLNIGVGNIVVLPIPNGQIIQIRMVKSTDGENDITIPIFESINAYSISCEPAPATPAETLL